MTQKKRGEGSGMQRRTISGIAAATLLLAASHTVAADDAASYPNRPVRLLAASAAGGNPDVVARLLSARLGEMFNTPFLVEDAPGAGGVVAANQTVAAP